MKLLQISLGVVPVVTLLVIACATNSAVGEADDASAQGSAAAVAADKLYTVMCDTNPETGAKECQVDKSTFVGWRFYHAFCHVCHAQDAVGSTFAPSLVEKLRVIDKARFVDVVENGYTGQIGVMPGWKDNPNISKRYNELYAYLKARSDGVLIPGRPKKIPAPK